MGNILSGVEGDDAASASPNASAGRRRDPDDGHQPSVTGLHVRRRLSRLVAAAASPAAAGIHGEGTSLDVVKGSDGNYDAADAPDDVAGEEGTDDVGQDDYEDDVTMVDRKVLVLGGGNFGTCLADHLSNLGLDVTLWARDPTVADSINLSHCNAKYMPEAKLDPALKATSVLDGDTIAAADVVLQVLTQYGPHLAPHQLLLFVNKGIETASGRLPCAVVDELLPQQLAAAATYLSGPSFAVEVVRRQPTCVVVASRRPEWAKRAQRLFHAPHFRVYTSADVVGVELAGAMKNVIALAAGACAGLGFGQNARAAIITRGLAEMIRVGVRLGADPLTFTGLAGAGDLLLTATSESSRNFRVGRLLGRGETLTEVLRTLGSVAEGVETARALYALCRDLGVDSPLCDAVHSVLFGGEDVKHAVARLMGRGPSSELRGISPMMPGAENR
ncbi:hypothetical protein HK405_002936 [Cladochytrium tenue]|nr:hypothetical protein HK405_002936 [Cladochytrium tenue]